MKVQKRSATLAVACVFAGTCSAAIATGSQSALDPTLFVKAPTATPTITTNTAKKSIAAPQPATNSVSTIFDTNEVGSTVTQFVKVDGVTAAEPVKQVKQVKKAKPNQGSSVIAGVNDKVKSAGGGIVDGTKSAGGTVVKGAKVAGEGIANVGGGLASGTKKMGDGIASGAKASGSFFLKGVHGMGSGLKAATSSIPGLGHGNKTQKPTDQSIAAKPAAVNSSTSPQTPQTATLPAANPRAAVPAATPVPQAQLAAAHPLKPAKLPPISQPKDLIVEHAVKTPVQKETPLWAPDKKVKPVVANQQLPTEPGMIGKAFNRLTFWKHNPQVAASTKKNPSPGPGM
jgi:hypothetical protein